MKILWINPSFLDYRVPVYAHLNMISEGNLTVLYSKNRVVPRVQEKTTQAIGKGAVGLIGEKRICFGDNSCDFSNRSIQLPIQRGLLSTVLKCKADVVIIEGFFQWSIAGLIRKLIRRTPLVLSYERTSHTERNCPSWRRFYRKCCLAFIDSALANGDLTKEYLTSLGFNPKRIVTGGMAADAEQLQVLTAQSRRHPATHGLFDRIERPAFLYVGQLTKRKGVHELLAGWSIFKSKCSGTGSLVIVGDGAEQTQAHRMVQEQRIPCVRFGGAWNYDKIHLAYAAADVFVIATLEDNWSLVVPEAMACGLPVLCSIYNGCHLELIEDERNGKTFDPLDEASLANALVWCSNNKHKLKEFGQRSVEIVDNFSPRKAAQAAYRACEIALNRAAHTM